MTHELSKNLMNFWDIRNENLFFRLYIRNSARRFIVLKMHAGYLFWFQEIIHPPTYLGVLNGRKIYYWRNILHNIEGCFPHPRGTFSGFFMFLLPGCNIFFHRPFVFIFHLFVFLICILFFFFLIFIAFFFFFLICIPFFFSSFLNFFYAEKTLPLWNSQTSNPRYPLQPHQSHSFQNAICRISNNTNIFIAEIRSAWKNKEHHSSKYFWCCWGTHLVPPTWFHNII